MSRDEPNNIYSPTLRTFVSKNHFDDDGDYGTAKYGMDEHRKATVGLAVAEKTKETAEGVVASINLDKKRDVASCNLGKEDMNARHEKEALDLRDRIDKERSDFEKHWASVFAGHEKGLAEQQGVIECSNMEIEALTKRRNLCRAGVRNLYSPPAPAPRATEATVIPDQVDGVKKETAPEAAAASKSSPADDLSKITTTDELWAILDERCGVKIRSFTDLAFRLDWGIDTANKELVWLKNSGYEMSSLFKTLGLNGWKEEGGHWHGKWHGFKVLRFRFKIHTGKNDLTGAEMMFRFALYAGLDIDDVPSSYEPVSKKRDAEPDDAQPVFKKRKTCD